MTALRLFLALALAACSGACGDDDGDGDGYGGARDGGGASGDDAGGEQDAGAPPVSITPAELPDATGECPGFADGEGCTQNGNSLICTFSPDGIEPRPVRIWIGEQARTQDGPLVVYWHGLMGAGSNAELSGGGLGPDVIGDIVARGGIVAAPERSEKRQMTGFGMLPWLLALGGDEDDDLLVLDEVVACADAAVGIDRARIHITGMSAGGLQTGQVVPLRSSYIASTAVFSGGQYVEPEIEDPDNLYPVILFHGGPNDMVVFQFDELQADYHELLVEQGHFVVLCNHGAGHSVPPAAATAAWEFLDAHPKGIDPEPWPTRCPTRCPTTACAEADSRITALRCRRRRPRRSAAPSGSGRRPRDSSLARSARRPRRCR